MSETAPVVWITGASAGIGRELALQYARRGFDTILTARSVEPLEALAEEVRDLGQRAVACPADVADWDAMAAIPDTAAEVLGHDRIDTAIANAGILDMGPVQAMDPATETRMVSVNINGVIHVVHAALPGMIERKAGRLVGVASLAGMVHTPTRAAYSSTKAFVIRYMDCVRLDLLGTGVSVTVVNPGYVESSMTVDVTSPLPFMWPADRAAKVIVAGVERGKRRVDFPWQLHSVIKAGQLLPLAIRDRLLSRQGGTRKT